MIMNETIGDNLIDLMKKPTRDHIRKSMKATARQSGQISRAPLANNFQNNKPHYQNHQVQPKPQQFNNSKQQQHNHNLMAAGKPHSNIDNQNQSMLVKRAPGTFYNNKRPSFENENTGGSVLKRAMNTICAKNRNLSQKIYKPQPTM